MPHARRYVVVAMVLAGATACGSSSSSEAHRLPPAAEPSHAPIATGDLPGRILALPPNSYPEGIIADHRTGTVVVALRAPDRLALIDANSLRVRIRPTVGRARHLVLAKPGGPVLLPAEDDNMLYQLSLPSGRVEQATAVLDHPHNADQVGRNVWVADELAPAVSVIGPDGRVVKNLLGPMQPGGVVNDGHTVGVVDVRRARMYFYDASSFAAEGSIALGNGPTHAVSVGDGYAVAADTRGGALLLVDLATRSIVNRLSLPGGPYGMASDPATGRAWVTLTATNQLVELSTTHHRMTEIERSATVQQPNSVAVDPVTNCTYVAGYAVAKVQAVCPH